MKQKLQEIRKQMRGSILVYTLIIMSILLATALSIAAVSVMERKNAGNTGNSNQAFAVADSGTEVILQLVRRDNHTTASDITSNLPTTPTSWTASDITGTCIISGTVSGGNVEIIMKDDADTIIADCQNTTAEVYSVKSTGKYLGTTRAVEVAVAAGECSKGETTFIVAQNTANKTFTSANFNSIVSFIERGGALSGAYCYRTSSGAAGFHIASPYLTIGTSSSMLNFLDNNMTVTFNCGTTNGCLQSTNDCVKWIISGFCDTASVP